MSPPTLSLNFQIILVMLVTLSLHRNFGILLSTKKAAGLFVEIALNI